MITSPGFSFSNVTGKHHIDTADSINLDNVGPLYSEVIICDKFKSIVQVYSHRQNLSPSNSIALEFVKIDIRDNQAILNFCDKYGLINSTRNSANTKNEYIFQGISKTDFTKKIPLPNHECVRLTDIKKAISSMRLLLELNSAIQKREYDTIVKIISFFCFDLTVRHHPGANPSTELSWFNREFYFEAIECGYQPFDYDKFDYSNTILSLIEKITADKKQSENYHKAGAFRPRIYPLHEYSQWRHICALFDDILSVTELQSITPFGDVIFEPELSKVKYLKTLTKHNLLNLAKAVLTDLFKENLRLISPELQYGTGHPVATWRIPTLLSAMYLELFFQLSPGSQFKICADPTCRQPFRWTSSKPNQKYCSPTCALRMAKRNQRKREKEQKKQ